MARQFVGFLLIACSAVPARADSWSNMSLPDLVGYADVILVGTVDQLGPPCRVKVTEVLAGSAGDEVLIPQSRVWSPRVGERAVFFLRSHGDKVFLFHPSAKADVTVADQVRRLLDMRAAPAKYLTDPKTADSSDFVAMLGYAFATRDKIGDLDRPAAARHLRRVLSSADAETASRVLTALRQIGSKNAAAVLDLLKRPEANLRREAIQYLGWTADRTAVGPLCELLDGITGYSELEEPIGRALIEMNDPVAIPALERAARRGVYGATSWALGRLGTKRSFEILLEGVKNKDAGDAREGMAVLVRRSNKRFEPWMGVGEWSSETGMKHKEDWLKWWDANKADFEVVRTAQEAFRSDR
jgi:hypothetical protein